MEAEEQQEAPPSWREVSLVCWVRPELLGPAAPFTVWRELELGGAFRAIPALDANPRGAVFASTYPQRQGPASDVLLRAELGAPGVGSTRSPEEAAALRVAVRSASHLVSRAVAQAALEVVGGVVGPSAPGRG